MAKSDLMESAKQVLAWALLLDLLMYLNTQVLSYIGSQIAQYLGQAPVVIPWDPVAVPYLLTALVSGLIVTLLLKISFIKKFFLSVNK